MRISPGEVIYMGAMIAWAFKVATESPPPVIDTSVIEVHDRRNGESCSVPIPVVLEWWNTYDDYLSGMGVLEAQYNDLCNLPAG